MERLTSCLHFEQFVFHSARYDPQRESRSSLIDGYCGRAALASPSSLRFSFNAVKLLLKSLILRLFEVTLHNQLHRHLSSFSPPVPKR